VLPNAVVMSEWMPGMAWPFDLSGALSA